MNPELLKQQLADNATRNAIKGKFGQCKRRFGLAQVMARRRGCSETVIAMTFLAANLIRGLWSTETFLVFRFRPVFFMEREPVIIPFFQNAA
ncbi:MAG: transposase [Victivallales bacterium]